MIFDHIEIYSILGLLLLTAFSAPFLLIKARKEHDKLVAHEERFQSYIRTNPIIGGSNGTRQIDTSSGGAYWFGWKTEGNQIILEQIPKSVMAHLKKFDEIMGSLPSNLLDPKNVGYEKTPDVIFSFVVNQLANAGFRVELVPADEVQTTASNVPSAQTQAITAQPENNEPPHGAQQLGLSPT